MIQKEANSSKAVPYLLIIVASLGYFVDIYDLVLFNVVKADSLRALGLSGEAIKEVGLSLFNWQMSGMLVGGIIWGIMGDKIGRIKVLFGSILMYSVANICNAFVPDITWYAIIRFIAGIGLAGELGAGITLISESMDKEKRGYGTMIIVTFGALGALFAYYIGTFGWKEAYIIGGIMGLALLLMRVGTYESGMFKNLENEHVFRGNFLMLFKTKEIFLKYLYCILIGLPVWFIVGVLINLSESHFAEALGITGKIVTGKCVFYCYLGLSLGDLVSGFLSQLLRSRKKVVFIFLASSLAVILLYLFGSRGNPSLFYFTCMLLGAGTGYWALFVTIASEQFGTNIRSTVTTTVPNFVRGAVVPITLVFKYIAEKNGAVNSAWIVGSVCLLLAFFAMYQLKETFAKELDYLEIDA